ncbi:MAG TPA: TlpA disulfide reductase family protein [Microvirga sp.]|nr:TlpA disulfide reductase family protein [Microvirga sp.]
MGSMSVLVSFARLSRPRTLSFALAALLAAAAGAAWLGMTRGSEEAAVAQECRASRPTAQRLAPLAKGEVAAVLPSHSPAPAPEIDFLGPAGEATSLSAFKGKTVLVNLWATWCLPCRQEMPALDALQAKYGGSDFEVVAINVDTRNPEKPKTWLAENGIRNLAYYAEPTGKLLQILQRSGHAIGLPTTLLVDAAGCEIAILKGPAEWASEDALALIRAALGRPA